MSNETVSVSGPVKVVSDSSARVAYDLMHHVSAYEKENDKDRHYWLTLYHQCRKAVDGRSLKTIFESE